MWLIAVARQWLRDSPSGGCANRPPAVQIAEELSAKLPDMFQNHRLHQAWAYKYSKARIGINVRSRAAGRVCASPCR